MKQVQDISPITTVVDQFIDYVISQDDYELFQSYYDVFDEIWKNHSLQYDMDTKVTAFEYCIDHLNKYY